MPTTAISDQMRPQRAGLATVAALLAAVAIITPLLIEFSHSAVFAALQALVSAR